MAKHKNLVWLASYPKSGNTWTRIFLANYLLKTTTPMPINQVHRIGMGDSIAKAYALVAKRPIDTKDFRGTLALRPHVLRGIANNGADINLVKTHNIRDLAFGTELIPTPLTRSAVYILRNPLDMVVSYARHYAMTPEATVSAIARADNSIAADAENVMQFLGNWSRHVKSWTEKAPFPVLTLRYEDMHETPVETFGALVRHLGMEIDESRLARAIKFSSFDEVSGQEAKTGFVERSANSEKFFHSGRSGQWETALSPNLVDRICADHGTVMKRHGYLP